jgi:RimJ/RimL family protein N-acetyltransferase
MKIQLIPLEIIDYFLVVEWVNEFDQDFLVQWAGLTYSFPLTIEQVKEHYSKGINSLESNVFIYMIMDLISHKPIGSIQLCRFDMINKEAIVGRFLIKDENHRGRGIGKRALNKLIQIGFETFCKCQSKSLPGC